MLITRAIGIPKQMLIARLLSPEAYGIIGVVTLWQTFAGLCSLGTASAANREVPYLVGKGRLEEAVYVQNIGVTSDLIIRIGPFIALIIASFAYSDPVFRIGLVIIAFFLVINSLQANIDLMCFARQEYKLVFRGRFIGAVVGAATVVALIHHFHIYAIFISLLVSATTALLYYLKFQNIDFRFQLEWTEVKSLMGGGVVFVILGLIYNGFRLVDRTIGAYFESAGRLSMHDFGLYIFAATFIKFGAEFIRQSISAFTPSLYEEAGKSNDVKKTFSVITKIAVICALVAAAMIPLAHVSFFLMVEYITPKYADSVLIFNLLTINFVFATLYGFANSVMVSPMVNKQNLNVKINFIALMANGIFDVAALTLGYGMLGVALGAVVSQGAVTLVFYYRCRKYITETNGEFFLFIFRVLLPLTLSAGNIFLLDFLHTLFKTAWLAGLTDAGIQLAAFSLLILVFYRSYIPKKLRDIIVD